jgi:hypothetical protein
MGRGQASGRVSNFQRKGNFIGVGLQAVTAKLKLHGSMVQ